MKNDEIADLRNGAKQYGKNYSKFEIEFVENIVEEYFEKNCLKISVEQIEKITMFTIDILDSIGGAITKEQIEKVIPKVISIYMK